MAKAKGVYAGYAAIKNEEPIQLVFKFSIKPSYANPHHVEGEPTFHGPFLLLINPDAKSKTVLRELKRLTKQIEAQGVFHGVGQNGQPTYKRAKRRRSDREIAQ